jgi:hypothetical protein
MTPMRTIRHAIAMPWSRKLRALRAVGELSLASVRLRATDQRRLVELLGDAQGPGTGADPEVPAELGLAARQIGRVVERVARVLPWHPTCLRQALAGNRMLKRAGIPHVIHLGVSDAATLGAHAWVTVGGRIVIGAGGVKGHTPVARFVHCPMTSSMPIP